MNKIRMALDIGGVGTEIEIESEDETHEMLVEMLAASIKTVEEARLLAGWRVEPHEPDAVPASPGKLAMNAGGSIFCDDRLVWWAEGATEPQVNAMAQALAIVNKNLDTDA